MKTTLVVKLSQEVLETFLAAVRDRVGAQQITVEAQYQQAVAMDKDSAEEIVPHTERITFTDAGSQSIELGTVEGQIIVALLRSDGSVSSSKSLKPAQSLEYQITAAEVESLLAGEPTAVVPSSVGVERRAQFIPIGGVKPDFTHSQLAVHLVDSTADFNAGGALSALGFTRERSTSIELDAEQADKLRQLSWASTRIGVDGRFVFVFDRPIKDRAPSSAVGWVWWLNGARSLFGFVKDELVGPQREIAIPLPALRPLPSEPEDRPPCGCETSRRIVPADVTEEEVADNPGIYTEDPGAFCKPFSNPERVLNEKAFAVVARVQQPDIGPMGSVRVHTQHLLDLDLSANVMLATDTTRRNMMIAQPISRDAISAAVLGSGRPRRVKTPKSEVLVQERLPSGRVLMDAKNPAQWEDDIAQYQSASVALGHILEFRVRTRSNGYSLGNVASTLTLAPRQTKRIQKIEFERLERARREESTQQADSVSDELTRERDYNDTVAAYLSEWATGSSSSGTAAAAGGIGFAIPPVVGGVGGGTSKAWSESSQEGARTTGASEQQRLRDAIRRHGDSLRRLQSTVVTEIAQQETVTGTTEILRNPNYGHSLTVIYYQILRHLKVTTEFSGVRECLFVPFAIKPFTYQRAYRWREAIEKYLRSRRYLNSLKYLRDVVTDFQYSNLEPGTRAQQKLTYMRGSIYLKLAVERPHDTADEKFDALRWQPFTPFLGHPAQSIWARLAERALAERDQIFQREYAPVIAAKWVNKLRVEVGGTDLQADCTLATRYGFNGTVRVDFVVPAHSARLYSRAQLHEIKVVAASDLPAGSVATVTEMSIRYGTTNFERTIRGLAGADDLVTPGTGSVDAGALLTFPLDAWDNVDERMQMTQSVNELIEHLNEHVEYYHKAIWWNMDRDRLFMLLDGFYVPGTDKVSIASVVDREPIAIIGNSLVYRVGAGCFLGLGKITSPSQLYEAYAGREPAQDPLLISLPTDGLYAQTIMDECLALEEHQGSVDWVLDDPDPDLGTIDPSLLASRRADIASTLTPTTMPGTIINLQNAPDAPAPAGLAGVLDAVTTPNVFRDMAGLAGTQANAAAALNTAANMATQFSSQAAALKIAELTSKTKATQDANRKLAAVQKAKDAELISAAEAAEHTNKILNDMHTTEGGQEQSDTFDTIAQQLLEQRRSGTVAQTGAAGVRVIDIKPAEFQADDSGASTKPTIVVNSNLGGASKGRVAIFSFGTFKETNRFKTESFKRGFFDTDVLFNSDPTELIHKDGVGVVQMAGAESVLTLFRTEPDDTVKAKNQRKKSKKLWKKTMPDGDTYKTKYEAWINTALQDDIDCLYLTGHHWTPTNTRFNLSTGVLGESFRFTGETGKDKMNIGYSGTDDLEFDVTPIRKQCKLIFGFGCDIATTAASTIFQDVFGRGENDVPVVCGWNTTVGLPKWDQTDRSPNVRYFEFLQTFANANIDPANPPANLLQWFYDNHPLELVRAWGHATQLWIKGAARARGKDGKFYKFKLVGGVIEAVEDA